MKFTTIPNTNIKVSKICLGTMTFGQQNTEKEAHDQLNYAINNGVNFIDTAEMYSIPGKKETQGSTERYIGSWLKDKKRDDLVVASKITGPMEYFKYIRDNLGFSPEILKDALEQSLTRLNTDYLDLYQLHWPERKTNYFGQRNYFHDENDQWEDNFKSVLESLDTFVKEGKIRHYGISNETSWGLMKQLSESKYNNLPRCKTIQNPYSLLNRTFEINLSEVAIRENVGLLAYSPLGFGSLSGKYLGGKLPEGSRLKLFPNYSRYNNKQAQLLTEMYLELAKELGLSLAELSLAFVNKQIFLTSTIIGATNLEQLAENIGSIDIELSEETMKRIDQIHELQPNPSP